MRASELEEFFNIEDWYWWFVGHRRLVASLIRRYAPGPALRILDVGCGSGGTLAAVRDQGSATGCDLSPDALRLCRQRSLKLLAGARAEHLCFASEVFDVVLSCDVLEHLQRDDRALDEIERVLKPGGVAIITVPAYPWLWSAHDEVVRHQRRYSRRQLMAVLRGAGLRIELLSYAFCLPFPATLAARMGERVRHRPLRPDQTDFIPVPAFVNRILIGLLGVERWLIPRTRLPWGSSLVAVVRKAASPEARREDHG